MMINISKGYVPPALGMALRLCDESVKPWAAHNICDSWNSNMGAEEKSRTDLRWAMASDKESPPVTKASGRLIVLGWFVVMISSLDSKMNAN
jgi:hypothetical protein